MKDLIKKLTEAWGPSGYEHHIRKMIQEEITGLADEVKVDPLGNLICRVGQGGAKVLVAGWYHSAVASELVPSSPPMSTTAPRAVSAAAWPCRAPMSAPAATHAPVVSS